ncbi:hypothetical protein IWX90DRAFT_435659 [Phyllosticta citrichinensis]|uniref:Utp8 beta-propeller domain-containing protein n=1 Tax=Phyllosticta citrichinensis TaxID=1130410 RepID=A0ABR1XQP9_9PEZI
MSSGQELEAPHTLASLPKPIDPINGRTLASTVYSLSSARKRKRSEIAVSVDGDSLSIYSIQTPRLITSYALAPQITFTAPPLSVYSKASKQRPAKRFTYGAVRESSGSARRQILCFAEDVQNTPTGNPEKTSYTIPSTSSNVFSVEVLPLKDSDDTHEVVVLYEDGQIDCLSADLQTQKSSAKGLQTGSNKGSQGSKVEYAIYTDANTARRGLFKSREDVIAALDPTVAGDSEALENTTLLCMVTRPADQTSADRTLRVFCVRAKTMGGITLNRPVVQNLLDLPVPRTGVEDTKETSAPSYSLHVSTGLLYQLSAGSIYTHDFSNTTPCLKSELTVPGTPLQNFVRVSSSLLMAVSPVSCGLYDVKYNSVQAILPLGQKSESSKGKKRKQSISLDSPVLMTLLHHVHDLGMVVGLANDELVGLQVGTDLTPSKRAKVRGGLLIDAIGKGVGHKAKAIDAPSTGPYPLGLCLINPADAPSKEWQSSRKKLDAYIKEDDVKNFEELLAKEVGIPLKGKEGKPLETKANGTNGTSEVPTSNGDAQDVKVESAEDDSEDQLTEWNFPTSAWDVNLQTKRHKAVYLLKKVFALSSEKKDLMVAESSKHTTLRIRFFPPNAFQWLIWTGFLATDMIRQAMRQDTTGVQTITASDVIASIIQFDPGMQLLCDVLKGHPALDVHLIVQAIKVLIQSLETTSFPEIKGQLTARPNDSGEDAVNTEDEEKAFETEADAAAWALARAESFVDHGILVRSHSLLEALTKLHASPAPLVTQTLRDSLTHKEIIFLLDILRMELHEGGWINTYLQDGPHKNNDFGDPSDRAIAIIADLLGCALDAIGAGGWLTSGADAKSETVHSLRMEVSAALEGIHEAQFMKGLLNDFVRYRSKLESAQRGRERAPTAGRLSAKGKPITVHTVEDPILPIGFKVTNAISMTSTNLRGEVKQRTKRDIGKQISMNVGKYTYDRIDV